MGRRLLALLALTGCDTVLGIDELYDCPSNDDDCDQLLDADDPCPADPGNLADEDGDRVGDACDPNLALSGDTISVFEGFATEASAWIVQSGAAMWGVSDSALVQADVADGQIQRMVETVIQPTLELVIDVQFPAEGSVVGVYVATPVNVPLECRIVHHDSGDDLVMMIAGTVLHTAPQLPGRSSDGLRIYGGQLPDGTIRCRARYGDNDSLYVDLTDPVWKAIITPRATIDRIGVRTIQASARFRSVVLYSVP